MAVEIRNFSSYQYKLSKFIINIGKEKHELQAAFVKKIYIEKDFDNDHSPILMVQIMLKSEIYADMCQKPKDTTINMNISVIKTDDKGKATSNKATFLSGTFVPVPLKGTPHSKSVANDKEDESNTKYSISDIGEEFTLILTKKSSTNMSMKIINKVLVNTDLTDAICYLLTKCGAKNVLMSKLDNNTTYKELLLLPVSIPNQISYLSDYFGLYKQGALVFVDFDTFYIIRKKSKCTAYRNNEIKNVVIHIYKTGGASGIKKGSYVDNSEKKGHIIISDTEYEINDGSSVMDKYSGNNALIINDDGKINKADTDDNGSYRVITTTSHSKYTTSETKARLEESKCTVSINAKDIDLRLLTPNKHYKILSNDYAISKKVNHSYRLSGYSAIFITEGDKLSTNISMQLKKSEA